MGAIILIVVVIFVLYVIGKNSTKTKIKQDPAIRQAIQFLIAARSMPKGSENLRLILKIDPSSKEPLLCQYQDIGEQVSVAEPRNELYDKQMLEALLVKKRFPSYTFIDVLQGGGWPYGYVLMRDWTLAHSEYIDKYMDAIIVACQQSNIPLISQECGSDYLVIEPR